MVLIYIVPEAVYQKANVGFELLSSDWLYFKEAEKQSFKSKIWKPKISSLVIKNP